MDQKQKNKVEINIYIYLYTSCQSLSAMENTDLGMMGIKFILYMY